MGYIVLDCEWNRPEKKSMLKKNKTGVVLYNELMQIGAVKLDEHMKITDEFSSNIKPIVYKIIHHDVQRLTHINRLELVDAPYFPDVWKKFSEWFDKDDILVTWGPTDINVINNNLMYWNIDLYEYKTMDLQREIENRYFEDHQNKSLEYVLEYLGIKQDLEPHIAINDAVYAAKIIEFMTKDKK